MPRPFFLAAWIATALAGARAQDPMRPWLRWRTVETPNYRFHYPESLEAWTLDEASRVESIDSAIAAQVGYSPDGPTNIVVDDPYEIANGYALPFLDRPVSVWWASPPNPREVVGDFTTWGDMLASHELTHIAHLARPSRNPLTHQFWASMPVNIGPLAIESPRWLYEGYAVVVEGRVTGAGRPHGIWRPAILRQWAIEGRLPTYGQLSDWGSFNGGEFAYLGGSAFLEWLARQEGDSSLQQLWRRMSARRMRSFETAFTGVYGDPAAIKYGQHMAELTRDAMAAKAQLEKAGLVEGELIQRLSWSTGDPAVSPDGSRIALVLRGARTPGRVVVWSTATEHEDSASVARRIQELKQDPFDVPDRQFYPRRKRELDVLEAWNGRSFQQPRWFRDNRRLLLTRWTLRGDGTLRPDLYIWNTETDVVQRVTHGESIVQADPSPNGRTAIAAQCHAGQCDIATVDLAGGRVQTVLAGSPHRSYYRPRWSPDASRFVASESENGRWRVVVANADGSGVRYVEPPDSANRYDAEWLPAGDTLVVVSERGGIANLELLSIADAATRTLTRVTGAAVAPDVSTADGAIWFLNMHSRGFDVRRLSRRVPPADSVVPITAEQFGFAGVEPPAPRVLRERPVASSHPYGSGPRFQRWVPGASLSGDGASGTISVFSGDIIGRLNSTASIALGRAGTAEGGALRLTWRGARAAFDGEVFGFIHNPSDGPSGELVGDSLDASVLQAVVATAYDHAGENLRWRARAGISGGALNVVADSEQAFRGLAFGEMEMRLLQLSGASGLAERLHVYVAHAHAVTEFQRILGTLTFSTIGATSFPIDLRGTLGWMHGPARPFERFTIGGAASPVADSSIMSQRYSMPMFPTGIAVGRALCAWHASVPEGAWSVFFEGASAASDVTTCRQWNRAIGFEKRWGLPPVPPAFSPRIEAHLGAGYTLDAPFRHLVRAFLEMTVEP